MSRNVSTGGLCDCGRTFHAEHLVGKPLEFRDYNGTMYPGVRMDCVCGEVWFVWVPRDGGPLDMSHYASFNDEPLSDREARRAILDGESEPRHWWPAGSFRVGWYLESRYSGTDGLDMEGIRSLGKPGEALLVLMDAAQGTMSGGVAMDFVRRIKSGMKSQPSCESLARAIDSGEIMFESPNLDFDPDDEIVFVHVRSHHVGHDLWTECYVDGDRLVRGRTNLVHYIVAWGTMSRNQRRSAMRVWRHPDRPRTPSEDAHGVARWRYEGEDS